VRHKIGWNTAAGDLMTGVGGTGADASVWLVSLSFLLLSFGVVSVQC
jgi:hypothetical protein